MEKEIRGSRIVHLNNHDLELAREKKNNISQITRVREKEIASFCNSCDQLLSDNTCKWIDNEEQATRVIIEKCDLASENGKFGTMTSNGLRTSEENKIKEVFLKIFHR